MEINEQLLSQVIQAALEILKNDSWDLLTFERLAVKTNLTPIQLYHIFPTRCDLLKGISQAIDSEMMALYQQGKAEVSSQEKLFDLIMCRFEAMNTHKNAMQNILLSIWRDPLSFPSGVSSGLHSMQLILDTSGIAVGGLKGILNLKIFSFFYLYALKIWLEDETPDMAKTMAHIDQGLKNIISFLNV